MINRTLRFACECAMDEFMRNGKTPMGVIVHSNNWGFEFFTIRDVDNLNGPDERELIMGMVYDVNKNGYGRFAPSSFEEVTACAKKLARSLIRKIKPKIGIPAV